MTDGTETVERKVSSTGQIRLHAGLDTSEFLAFEPGVYTLPSTLRLYPVSDPPTFHGELSGEISRVNVSTQNQITIPSEFREAAGLHPGTWVRIDQEDNYLALTPVEKEQTIGKEGE